MHAANFVIQNKSTKTLHFHIEPDCTPFAIEPGESVELQSEYRNELPTVQISDDDGGFFFAVFPGDGDLAVKKDGETVT
jgi:hypothetical protein